MSDLSTTINDLWDRRGELSPDDAEANRAILEAVTLLDRALLALEDECRTSGKHAQFELLSPWLTGEAEHGDQAELAEKLGVSPGAVKSLVHRLRRRFRSAVQSEVERTISDRGDLDAEMAALFAVLGGGQLPEKHS